MQNPNAIECISIYAVEIPFQARGSGRNGRGQPEFLDSTVLGIPMYVQYAGGSAVTQAAIVHLAHSVAPERLLYLWDIGDLVSVPTVRNPVPGRHGRMHAHELPGLGVEPLPELFGEAVAVYG